jgi:hypothetical protein
MSAREQAILSMMKVGLDREAAERVFEETIANWQRSAKWSFVEVEGGWVAATVMANQEGGTKEKFQEYWSKVLAVAGWTREEYHKALEARASGG